MTEATARPAGSPGARVINDRSALTLLAGGIWVIHALVMGYVLVVLLSLGLDFRPVSLVVVGSAVSVGLAGGLLLRPQKLVLDFSTVWGLLVALASATQFVTTGDDVSLWLGVATLLAAIVSWIERRRLVHP